MGWMRRTNASYRSFWRGLAAQHGVAREVHYPSSAGRKLTHRQRCDLVLTPINRPLRLDSAPPSLFDAPDLCGPDEALWLEVKIAYQFREGGSPSRRIRRTWRNAVVEDLRKMENEPQVKEAGLLLIVFNEAQDVLEKDLDLFETVLMQKEVLAGFRQVTIRSDPGSNRPQAVQRCPLADHSTWMNLGCATFVCGTHKFSLSLATRARRKRRG